MVQHARSSPTWLAVCYPKRLWRLLVLHVTWAFAVFAQTPQQQYVYGSIPVTVGTSQLTAYSKNSPNGALSPIAGSPFPDNLQGGAMAVDGLGRFLFVVNPGTSNISMLQIDSNTGVLTEVPGSHQRIRDRRCQSPIGAIACATDH